MGLRGPRLRAAQRDAAACRQARFSGARAAPLGAHPPAAKGTAHDRQRHSLDVLLRDGPACKPVGAQRLHPGAAGEAALRGRAGGHAPGTLLSTGLQGGLQSAGPPACACAAGLGAEAWHARRGVTLCVSTRCLPPPPAAPGSRTGRPRSWLCKTSSGEGGHAWRMGEAAPQPANQPLRGCLLQGSPAAGVGPDSSGGWPAHAGGLSALSPAYQHVAQQGDKQQRGGQAVGEEGKEVQQAVAAQLRGGRRAGEGGKASGHATPACGHAQTAASTCKSWQAATGPGAPHQRHQAQQREVVSQGGVLCIVGPVQPSDRQRNFIQWQD